ncbi:hypothetical protein TIFTF001_043969 [Ficus carica]|uniref:Uncharacterized protein n=1 Tax=Ficus carica TaxID=3494 RepID=A0AA87ZL39_FICCA|nr:hypothetical protein TIFTF001_043969 [Ficus carica]
MEGSSSWIKTPTMETEVDSKGAVTCKCDLIAVGLCRPDLESINNGLFFTTGGCDIMVRGSLSRLSFPISRDRISDPTVRLTHPLLVASQCGLDLGGVGSPWMLVAKAWRRRLSHSTCSPVIP